MSERKLSKEQEDKLQTIKQEWIGEVEQFFDAHRDEDINCNRLDGSGTWGLVAIEQKYKRMVNEELGWDFYGDVAEVKKSNHRKFSDLVVKNPNGFPELPKRK